MNDYIIMEYDFDKRKYTSIGIEEGQDSTAAKQAFIKKHDWQPREGVMLFAKPPLCR